MPPFLTYTGQAEGAIANGSRVRKVRSEPGDAHPDGTLGTVIGSAGPFSEEQRATLTTALARESEYGYFIEWDAMPGTHVFTCSAKVEPA